MALFLIPNPVTIVLNILKISVLPQTVFLSVHPLSIVNLLFLQLSSSWFSQQHSRAMLFVLLELAAILQILLVEVVDSVAFNPLASPGADVHVTVGEGVLLLDQFAT